MVADLDHWASHLNRWPTKSGNTSSAEALSLTHHQYLAKKWTLWNMNTSTSTPSTSDPLLKTLYQIIWLSLFTTMLRYSLKTSGHWACVSTGIWCWTGKKCRKAQVTLWPYVRLSRSLVRMLRGCPWPMQGMAWRTLISKRKPPMPIFSEFILCWDGVRSVKSPFVVSPVSCVDNKTRKCSQWKSTYAMVHAIIMMSFSYKKLMTSSTSLKVIMRRKLHYKISSSSSRYWRLVQVQTIRMHWNLVSTTSKASVTGTEK